MNVGPHLSELIPALGTVGEILNGLNSRSTDYDNADIKVVTKVIEGIIILLSLEIAEAVENITDALEKRQYAVGIFMISRKLWVQSIIKAARNHLLNFDTLIC